MKTLILQAQRTEYHGFEGPFKMLAQCKRRVILEVFRSFYTTSRIGVNHYEVLGVTPKATQNDIKSAYYKLSKLYHPDISKGDESAKKFRSITEAYEVLGNIQLKKIYDKGLLVGRASTTQPDYKPDEEPTDPSLKFYKSRRGKNIVPTMDGNTPIYDFDAWSKHHYGNLFKKSQDEKVFIKKQTSRVQSANQEITMYIMCVLGGLFIVLISYGTTDYDVDIAERKEIATTQNNVNLDSNSNR